MSDYMAIWRLRKQALEKLLGKADDTVATSLIPIYLGGSADVMTFSDYIAGKIYVTGGLIGLGQQKPSERGEYELMICTKQPSSWAPTAISRLAPYTHEAVLNWNETMDIGPIVPPPSLITAFLFANPGLAADTFDVGGTRCHLVMCMGITASELNFKRKHGAPALIQKLSRNGEFPYTDLERRAVV